MTAAPANNAKILLVEDEESLAVGMQFNLEAEGYAVRRAGDGRQALEMFAAGDFDLIILDIMLPFVDGFAVAAHVRETAPQLPILMLTARAKVEDRVRGLEIGADDYLTKPFHLEELLARVRGMLRRKQWYRAGNETAAPFSFGPNSINFATLECRAGKKSFRLTYHEAMVMKYLIERQDQIVSRKELLENVWNISSEVETRTVDNFIVRLRKYFEPDPKNPTYIKSVRSAGYIFSAEQSP